jgi:hypothetical protein
MPWIIQDWTGARKFPEREFGSFEAGFEFLEEKYPDDEDRGEFEVVEVEGEPAKLSLVELGNVMLREAGAEKCQAGYGTVDPEWVGRYALQFGDIGADGVLN